jgi:hypothetical protein
MLIIFIYYSLLIIIFIIFLIFINSLIYFFRIRFLYDNHLIFVFIIFIFIYEVIHSIFLYLDYHPISSLLIINTLNDSYLINLIILLSIASILESLLFVPLISVLEFHFV